MVSYINSSFTIGSLVLNHRLIQGPLAGFSCASFRALFYQFIPPAYCVTEMISAHDVLHKHKAKSRYFYRARDEKTLCYQIAGTDPIIMAEAARRLEGLGADLIDINCGCPKTKIRKKGAGSALLDEPQQLLKIINSVRQAITIPLTVKIRIQGNHCDVDLAQSLEASGIDALIIHGRSWRAPYSQPSNLAQIALVKKSVSIPIIANGDIKDQVSLQDAIDKTGCDGYMISRAGTGKPWLYKSLLEGLLITPDPATRMDFFMRHLQSLASLENEHKAVLQGKSLIRYYFRDQLSTAQLQSYYTLSSLTEIENSLAAILKDEVII